MLLDDYFFNKQLRPATQLSYANVLQQFLKFTDGHEYFPSEVTKQDILTWRDSLLNIRKLSAHTWNNKIAHMRALFNYGIKAHNVLPENPFNGVSVRSDKKFKKTLSSEQMETIYSVLRHFSDMEMCNCVPHAHKCALLPTFFWQTVVDTLRYTGMRQNQLLGIRFCDISLKNNAITLRVENSKTHSAHTVPIISTLKPQLSQLMDRMQARGMMKDSQFFNVARLGLSKGYIEDMTEQPLRSFFKRLSKECHFAVTPHRFRHTIATEMMKSPDRNLQIVKNLLGHSSIATTLEYVDSNVEMVRSALEQHYQS